MTSRRLWDGAASRWHLPNLQHVCGGGFEAPLSKVRAATSLAELRDC